MGGAQILHKSVTPVPSKKSEKLPPVFPTAC